MDGNPFGLVSVSGCARLMILLMEDHDVMRV